MHGPRVHEPRVDRRHAIACGVLAGVLTLLFHVTIDRTTALIDDGGITLRYAERIASGAGFDYGVAEPINGATNPLYTFALAGLLWLGVGPWAAVQAVGFTSIGLAVGLLTYTFARFHSIAAAVFVAPALATNVFVSSHLVAGMEPPLTLVGVALLVWATHARAELWVGVALGLLVSNKLDGAAAAVAYTVAILALERRFPWRAALVAVLVALPTFAVIFATWGTLLPGAAVTKMTEHAVGNFDRGWMLDAIARDARAARLPFLAAGALVLLFGRSTRSVPLVVLSVWLVLHVAAYSSIDLGAPYPWYVVTPIALLVPLAGLVVARAIDLLVKPLDAPRRAWIAVGAIGILSVAAFRGSSQVLAADSADPSALHDGAVADLGRQVAGAWLRANTSGTEVFDTPFGLPAFEYGGPVYDSSGLNNLRSPARRQTATYAIGEVGDGSPSAFESGRRLVAFFRFGPNVAGYSLYAASGSELLRSGHVWLPGVDGQNQRPPDATMMSAATPRTAERIDTVTRRILERDTPPWARVR